MNARSKRTPSIALVYDHVTTRYGGAEVVLEQLHQLYPDAPLFTTVADTASATWAKDWQIRTSFLQHLPRFIRRRHQWQALIAPIAAESLDVTQYDIVISVSAGSAKGVITHPQQLHVCYLLTPTRYLYDDQLYRLHPNLMLPGVHWIVEQIRRYLRWWDVTAAHRPDHLVPISQLVSQRIKKYYVRDANTVIYPPFRSRSADTHALDPLRFRQTFDLIISRLVWYKNIEVAIAAALENRTVLVIVGTGPFAKRLQQLAGKGGLIKPTTESLTTFMQRATQLQSSILFCGALSDSETQQLLQNCRSLLMLGQEDFGMTTLEALMMGKPVVVNATSGVAELLTHRKHGLVLPSISIKAVTGALQELDSISFSAALLKQTALRYSDTVFRQSFATTLNQMWQQKEDYERTP